MKYNDSGARLPGAILHLFRKEKHEDHNHREDAPHFKKT